MSCHTAGITHATRHRSLWYPSVDLKCTSNVIHPSDTATAIVSEVASRRYISTLAAIRLALSLPMVRDSAANVQQMNTASRTATVSTRKSLLVREWSWSLTAPT